MASPEPPVVAILDQIHAAVRAADFAALALLEPQLALAMGQPAPIHPADLHLVRRRATRNAACLLAARQGILAARRRLVEIRGVSAGLVTYDRNGRRAEVGEHRLLGQRL